MYQGFTLSQWDFVAIVTECQSSSVIGEILKQQRHINYTCVNGIPSSHKCFSGWCTDRLNILIVEYNPFSGQRVNGWSVDFWSMKSNVDPPEIISKHKQNVRRRWFSLFCLQWAHHHEKCERKRNKTSQERHVTGIEKTSIFGHRAVTKETKTGCRYWKSFIMDFKRSL